LKHETDFKAHRLNDMTNAWVVGSRSVGPGVAIAELAADDRAESLVRSVDAGATGQRQIS